MTQYFEGWKPGYGPAVKVLVNDADDPLTLAKSQHAKFLFNSENTAVGYVDDIWQQAWNASYPNSGTMARSDYFFPSGSTYTSCSYFIGTNSSTSGGKQQWCYPRSYFGDYDYMPIIEQRVVGGASFNQYAGPGSLTSTSGGGWAYVGYTNTLPGYSAGSAWLTDNVSGLAINREFYSIDVISTSTKAVVSVWDLPADETALPADGTPVTGQEVVTISPSMVRIAKPGKTTADANPKNFVLHENRIPAKIVRAGQITLGSGVGTTATITVPAAFPLTKLTYMDFHVKKSTSADFFSPPYMDGNNESNLIKFGYVVSGQNVILTNQCSFTLNVRFLILADTEEDYTSGGSAFIFTANDGTRDFIQIKRPGSSDAAPNLNDIMLDTRLAYLPLLASGYLAWPTDFTGTSGTTYLGEKYRDVAISNPTGLLLMVKHSLVFPSYNDGLGNPFPKVTVGPQTTVMFNAYESPWNLHCNKLSSYAQIAAAENNVRFYMSGDNPDYLNAGTGAAVYARPSPIGLRYHVLGIPPNL